MTIIFFTRSLPNPIANELQLQGHIVFEALAISEVMALQEQNPAAQIVINHDVEPVAARVIQQRFPTLQLQANTTVPDVLFELSHQNPATIQ
jgi:hypothetical protein